MGNDTYKNYYSYRHFTAAALISRHDIIALDRDTNVQNNNNEILSFRTVDQIVRKCTLKDSELCAAVLNRGGPFAACNAKKVCYWSCTA